MQLPKTNNPHSTSMYAASLGRFRKVMDSHQAREPNPDLDHNPDVDHQPPPSDVPPDIDKGRPIRIPPDQPGLPEENQPDPPPEGDPPSNEPTRLFNSTIWTAFACSTLA